MAKIIRIVKLSRRQAALVFSKDRPPIKGDTITTGNMVAEFKKKI